MLVLSNPGARKRHPNGRHGRETGGALMLTLLQPPYSSRTSSTSKAKAPGVGSVAITTPITAFKLR